MRARKTIILVAALFAFLVGGCHSPRSIDLDAGLWGTQHGEYTLVVVTDRFVSFQNSSHKDQYNFTAPLPSEILARIRAAVAQGSTPSQPVHFEDARIPPRPRA